MSCPPFRYQFLELIPQLPRLHSITAARGNDNQTVIAEILQDVERLNKHVNVSLKVSQLAPTGIHYNSLKTLTCLSRLELFVLPQPTPPSRSIASNRNEDYMGMFSQILLNNAGLRTFHLKSNLQSAVGKYNYERYHNIPTLEPPSFRLFQNLHLEGDITFETDDWIRWDRCLDWTKIRKLTLIHLPLILQVLTRCLHRLPKLHTLRLDVHKNRARPEELMPLLDRPSCAIVKDFLLSNPLVELDLTGFTRDRALTEIVSSSGVRLRKMRLHVHYQEAPTHQQQLMSVLNLHLGETAFLDAGKLSALNVMCPGLEHLSLDMERRNGEVLSQQSVMALSAFRKLRSIEIYYHRRIGDPKLSEEDIIGIFVRLGSAKRGVQLECLTFQHHFPNLHYTLWEMGNKICVTNRSAG
ncbi:MAG: hypothetical protein Q9186_005458 [Xanthomendoza sp. 1 TL-2023]